MKTMFQNTELKKLFYGIGIITLILLAILYLIWNGDSEFNPEVSYKNAATDSLNTSIPQSQDMTGYLFKVIFVTIFIIVVLIIGTKWYSKFNKMIGSPSFIKILSKQHIGNKQFLMLIAVENKKILVGVTESSINHITDMGEYSEADDAKYNKVTESTSFNAVLNYFKKGKDE